MRCILSLLCVLGVWPLTGCLYSVHHFNTGLLMPAGKSEGTIGVGRQPLWKCSGLQSDSSDASHACGDSAGEAASHSYILKGSFDYRLGIKDAWGPFTGTEIEWHLEAPTNPASMEFALNLGLPGGSEFHHKVGGGWGIGAWADNSFFLEYAASLSMGRPLVFGNLRVTYLATQMGEVLGSDFSKPLPSDRALVLQSAVGIFYRLPEWFLVPDFLIPEINLTVPQIPSGDLKFSRNDIPMAQWDFNFGFGWDI